MLSDDNHITIPGNLKRQLIEAARHFRKEPTDSEDLLWEALRRKQLGGIKFRRQQPIGPFVVDFYAPAYRLVVEVDGAVHEQQQEADQARQTILESCGLRVIRFSAEQVETDITAVLALIRQASEE